jgi:sphinganine-1-phosphate aldolase
MIVPESVRVAWEKAAHYFKVKLIRAPLRSDLRVDVEAVKKMINKNTIMIVASAPSYPHGVIEPIEELGLLAHNHRPVLFQKPQVQPDHVAINIYP